MKLSNRLLATVRTAYLYANGRLVLVHEERHKRAGTVEYVTIHDLPLQCRFTGRIVVHALGGVKLLQSAHAVTAQDVDVSHGSENTRKRGIAVGYVSILFSDAHRDGVTFYCLPGLISGDWTYQPENEWTEPEVPSRWAGYPVNA